MQQAWIFYFNPIFKNRDPYRRAADRIITMGNGIDNCLPDSNYRDIALGLASNASIVKPVMLCFCTNSMPFTTIMGNGPRISKVSAIFALSLPRK
jgi:hypothetical protein